MASIKTTINIQSLDDELNLFDEESWDFLTTPILNKVENYEYFADIYDADYFGNKTLDNLKTVIINTLAVLSIFMVMWGAFVWYNLKINSDYNYQDTLRAENKIEYVVGTEQGNTEIIEASKTLNGYFRVINSGVGYDELNKYCVGNSSFCVNYNNYVKNIKENYDLSDCYARTLKSFGQNLKLDKIDKIIEKDGVYYCYLYLSLPTTENVYDYAGLYHYNMIKYFQSHEISENTILMFLLTNLNENPMPFSNGERCLKMKRNDDGSFVLVDDIMITTSCISAFTNVISVMSSMLGQADFGAY